MNMNKMRIIKILIFEIVLIRKKTKKYKNIEI